MQSYSLFGALALILLPTTLYGQPDWNAQAIVNGSPEAGMPTVASMAFGNDNSLFSSCTTNLIAPRVLLTAAHCVDDIDPQDLQGMRAYFGPDVREDGQIIRFDSSSHHPNYGGQSGGFEADIGVMVLSERPQGIAPSRFRMVDLTEYDICPGEYGCRRESNRLDVKSVGFGNDTTNSGGGTKRQATLPILGFGDASNRHESFLFTGGGTSNICFGDSGGPQFREVSEGIWEQWGVHSFIPFSNCRQDEGASARVDYYRSWVIDRIEEVHGSRDVCAINGFYDDGHCDLGCAEEDPDCAGCKASFVPSTSGPLGLILLLSALLFAGRLRI